MHCKSEVGTYRIEESSQHTEGMGQMEPAHTWAPTHHCSFLPCRWGVCMWACHCHAGSQFPDRGSSPCPLQWKPWVPTTGPPVLSYVASSEKAPLTPTPAKVALILPLSILSCCIIFLQWTHQLLIFCFLFPHFGCKPCENRSFVLPSTMSPALRTAPDTYQDSRNMDIYQIMCK